MVRMSMKSALLAVTALAGMAATASPVLAQEAAPAADPANPILVTGRITNPPPIAAFGQLPAVEDADLSPDGTRTAIARTVNGTREVVALDSQDRVIVRVPIGDQKFAGVQWAGNDYLIIALRRTAALYPGAPLQEIGIHAVVNLKSGKSYFVFGDKVGMIQGTFGSYGIREVDGRWVGYFGGVEMGKNQTRNERTLQGSRRYLYRVDLETGDLTQIVRSDTDRVDRSWTLDENGNRVVTLETESNGTWRIQNAEGRTIKSGKETDDRTIGIAGLSPDGQNVIYYQWDEVEYETVIREVSLTDGSVPATLTVPAEADGVLVDGRTNRAVGWVPEDDDALPIYFDEARNSASKGLKAAFPDSHLRIMDRSDDSTMLVFRTEGKGDAGTWYQMDMVTRSAWPLGNERPDIAANQVGEIQTIEYTAADGLAMEMIVTLPPGLEPKNLPVIMLPHGGPHAHDVPRWDWWAQSLASRGYVVVQPNFRGSTNKDRKFEEAGYGEWGAKMQSDLTDALTHLTGMGMIDPSRACIVGASYGGYAALAGVTVQQGQYKCAVSVAGVSDLPLQIGDVIEKTGFSPAYKRYFARAIGTGRDIKSISPAYLADRADAPILLIHGKDDSIVFINQSDRMEKELKKAGKPFEYIKLAGEDHWLSRGDTRTSMLEATIAFVEKHNPPGLM